MILYDVGKVMASTHVHDCALTIVNSGGSCTNIPKPSALHVHISLNMTANSSQYQTFWSDPQQVSAGWLSLLLAVGCVGAQVSGQSRRDAATLALAEELRRLTAHALVLAKSTRRQPHTIEALMLYEKSLLFKDHDTLVEMWHVHGQIMRLCHHAGYHRDPENNPAISPFNREMRRRIWMVAVEYDVLCGYQLGVASLITKSICDTKEISNLLDGDFSVNHVPASRRDEDFTLALASLYYNRLVAVSGDIMLTSHTIAPATKAEVKTLHERLDVVRNGLPQALKFLPLDQCFMDSRGQTLDRYRLELQYHKSLCVLYRRFLGQKGCDEEHQYCLQAAEATMLTLIPLLQDAQGGGPMAGYFVLIYRHIHDFNLAAILICAEIKRIMSIGASAKEDDKALTARVIPMSLHLCEMWGACDAVSGKARHAVRAVEMFLQQMSMEASVRSTPSTSSTVPLQDSTLISIPMFDIDPKALTEDEIMRFFESTDPWIHESSNNDMIPSSWT